MDQATRDLLQNRRFKEAQKALTKRLKKSPNNVALLVRRLDQFLFVDIKLIDCLDQISQAQLFHALHELVQCKKLCADLCTRRPPIVELESLTTLYAITCDLRSIDIIYQLPEATTLWQNAIGAAATTERRAALAEEWASQSIKYEHWGQLAKVLFTGTTEGHSQRLQTKYFPGCTSNATAVATT